MARVAAAKKRRQFDPKAFLALINGGKKLLAAPRKADHFCSGRPFRCCFSHTKRKSKLTVVSETGKEATIGILKEGDFFGEGCLTGQPLRLYSATTLTDCSVMRVDTKTMLEVLHEERSMSDVFVAYLLTRNIRYEEDLVDQLFNSSEKRLARMLLMLAHFGKEGAAQPVIPKISQETLAQMVGTTRSRINFFMNRFKKLGFIDYSSRSELQIHGALINIILHD